jgi:Ca-activated chloride channel family protein
MTNYRMTNNECNDSSLHARCRNHSRIRHSSFVIRHSSRRTGGMMVLIAICLPIFVMAAAFAVDVAYMQLTRTELRTATDAAARAGAKTLSLTQNASQAQAAARQAARRNRVAGEPLQVANPQIEIGFGDQPTENSRFAFTPGGAQLNAVRVTGLRTRSSAAGPVGLLLGRVLGVTEFQPSHVAASTQLDRELCLVVDRSGSMMWDTAGNAIAGPPCGPPAANSRWTALNTAVLGFVDELDQTPQQEQCALASYSSAGSGCGITFNTSNINADLAFSFQRIRDEMARLSSRPVQGGTSISAGIDRGVEVLTSPRARRYAVKTMVVMTDGLHNSGREPILSAQDAARANITINTVTFGDDADIRRMQDVANATGGQHFHAPDAAALEEIFREIASTLPVMLTE